MSLFGGLYVGSSGLKTSQNALNTVAHNLSNMNTTGYVRQQVAQSDNNYTTISKSQAIAYSQVGQGVTYSEVRHIRDYFLDQTYREESGRYSYYETSYSAVLEIEDILGELNGAAFKDSVENLWTAFEELSKSPSDSTYISLLVSSASSFVENASAVYSSFIEYQGNLNLQIKDMVTQMNAIGTRISELNKEISQIEVGGLEKANDLRDERDALLDTLSSFGNITYKEDTYGIVTVKFNGTDFVTDAGAYRIGLKEDLDTGFYTPYWEQNVVWKTDASGEKVADYSGAYLFDLTQVISSDSDTDVGGLRALLLARGDHVANYTDLTCEAMTDIKLQSLDISKYEYNEEQGFQYYNKYIKNSVMMNVEAEFDNLVHAIMTKVNEVLAENCDPKSGYLCNDDGTPMQIFQKNFGDAYVMIDESEIQPGDKVYQIYDENGNPTTKYWKFVEEDPNETTTLYNCANIKMNQKLLQTPTLLGFVKEDDSTDYNLGKIFVAAFEENGIYLNPNATKPSSFQDCYIDLVSQVANGGYVFKGLFEFQQLAVEQVESERQSVIGVSSDEELEHMIMYQNAYNAASRYINVINTLLDSVLSMAQ